MIILKSKREIEKMHEAGRIVAIILHEIKSQVKVGMSTLDIDHLAERMTEKFRVKPAFKGYKGFKHSICTSLNDEVVHGVPSKKRILKEGDILGLDFGVVHEGYYGDAAITISIGKIPERTKNLLKITQESLWKGISQMIVGRYLGDISHAVQLHVESHGFSVVREFVGHGIGQALHEEPALPNYGESGTGTLLKEGMILALEPMVNMGAPGVEILEDGWTVVTMDHSLSAHFEHTVAILSEGPKILTLSEEEINAKVRCH